MSNSPLVTYTKYSQFNSGKRRHVIDRITPHCVVGQCAIESLGALFSKPGYNASSNYGIDKDGRVGLFVDEDSISWCSGGNLLTEAIPNDHRAVTIECASDITAPWAFKPIVYERLVELCIDICKRNGKTKLLWIPDRDMALHYTQASDEMLLTVHRWFANKACPGDWMMERMDDLAQSVNSVIEPKPQPAEPWYAEAMAWAKEAGLINDGRPKDNLTRAEMATILQRFDKRIDEKIKIHMPEDDSLGGLITD